MRKTKNRIVLPLIFVMILMVTCFMGMSNVYAYTTGTVNDWSGILDDPSKYTIATNGYQKMFDNYSATLEWANNTDIVLNSPTDIYLLKVKFSGYPDIEFYDSNNVKLWTWSSGSGDVMLKDLNLSGVKRIRLCDGTINEFDIKGLDAVDDPAPPKNLRTTQRSTEVTLNWDAVANATGYNIKRALTHEGPYATIATNISDIYYVDKDLSNSVKDTYYYVVTAIAPTGESENSAQVSYTHPIIATTVNDWSGILDDPSKYTVVGITYQKMFDNYSATLERADNTDIVFNSPTDIYSLKFKFSGYPDVEFYDSNNVKLWSWSWSTIVDTVMIKDLNLNGVKRIRITEGTIYEFDIRGPETADDPAPPKNLITTKGSTEVKLNWDAVANATGYNVKRSLTNEGPYTTIASNISDIYYLDRALSNSVKDTYYYVVTAITPTGESENSKQVFYTHPHIEVTTGNNWSGILDDPSKYTVSAGGYEKIFDNDPVTWATCSNIDVILNSPTDIYSIKIVGTTTIEFYDSNNTKIWTRSSGYSNIMLKDLNLSNVKKIRFSSGFFYEFDITSFTPSTTLSSPQNLVASVNNNQITLTWSGVTNATGYNLKRAETPGGPYTTITSNLNNVTYRDMTALPDITYYYVVSAVNGAEESLNSNEVSVNLSAGTNGQPPAVPPAAPTGLSAEAVCNTIVVTWNQVPGAEGYYIEVDGLVEYDTGTKTAFIHKNLTAGQQYAYKVRARNGAGIGLWSNQIIQTVQPQTPEVSAIPDNINIVVNNTSVIISWSQVLGAVGYDIEADNTMIPNQTNTVYNHTGLLPGTSHTYRIGAKNPDGTLKWSSYITVSTLLEAPAAPTNLNAQLSGNTVIVTWDSVAGAEGYELDINGSKAYDGTSTTYVHSGLTYGTVYTYKVRAKNSAGPSVWSSPVVQSTALGIPANIQAAATNDTITITWEPVAGAQSYDIVVDNILVHNVTSPYTHTVAPGTTHSYKVRANSTINGDWSAEISKTTSIGIPANLTAVVNGSDITLTWDSVAGAENYDIGINGITYSTQNLTYTYSGLPGTQYTICVKARNTQIIGDWSAAVVKWTVPDTVTNVQAVPTDSTLNVSWNNVPGAAAYDIQLDNILIENVLNPHIISALTPDTLYTLKVRAKNEGGLGAWSTSVNVMTLPNTPNIINATATDSTITIQWSPTANAISYEVQVGTNQFNVGMNTTYLDAGLLPGTSYTYRVRAISANGISAWSTYVTKRTIPGIPQILTATPTDTSVLVEWSAVTGATAYEIELINGIASNGSGTIYTHNDLIPGTQYTYRVRSINESGQSNWSNPISVWTRLNKPTNILTSATSNKIVINWDAVSGATGYDILINNTITDASLLPTYTHAGLDANTSFEYKIRAKNGNTVSEWVTITVYTLIDTPKQVSAKVSGTDIVITWKPAVGATEYEIIIDNGEPINVGNVTEYTHQGPAPNVWHTYIVRAKNGDNVSEWSNEVRKKI